MKLFFRILKISIGVALLAWLLASVDYRELADTAQQGDPWLLALGVFMMVLSLPVFQAWRLHVLIEEINHRVANEYAEAIASLSLASSRAGDDEVKVTLARVANRLRDHADSHRASIPPPTDSTANLADYIGRICRAFSKATRDYRQLAGRRLADHELVARQRRKGAGHALAHRLVAGGAVALEHGGAVQPLGGGVSRRDERRNEGGGEGQEGNQGFRGKQHERLSFARGQAADMTRLCSFSTCCQADSMPPSCQPVR